MGQLGTDGACEDFFKSHGREGSQMVDLTQKIHIRVDSSEVTDLLDRLLDRLTKLRLTFRHDNLFSLVLVKRSTNGHVFQTVPHCLIKWRLMYLGINTRLCRSIAATA